MENTPSTPFHQQTLLKVAKVKGGQGLSIWYELSINGLSLIKHYYFFPFNKTYDTLIGFFPLTFSPLSHTRIFTYLNV